MDEYELIVLPLEQFGDSLQESTGFEVAPTMDTGIVVGLEFCEGSSMELHLEMTLAMDLPCLPL